MGCLSVVDGLRKLLDGIPNVVDEHPLLCGWHPLGTGGQAIEGNHFFDLFLCIFTSNPIDFAIEVFVDDHPQCSG